MDPWTLIGWILVGCAIGLALRGLASLAWALLGFILDMLDRK